MSYSDENFWPVSHIIVLGLLPVAVGIMVFDATIGIEPRGIGQPIMMVTATLASIQWEIRRRRARGEDV